MKTLALFVYHTIAALILNWRAARQAKAMRTGTPGSGQKLKDIGARSNEHEAAANEHWQAIQKDPVRHAIYAGAVLAAILIAVVLL